MVVACAGSHFEAVNGTLEMGYSAFGREVAWIDGASVGDGQFGQLTSTGKLMVDMRLHWKSTYDCPVICHMTYQRQRRTMQVSFGGFAYVRERYTYAVGVDTGTPILAPDPNTDPYWNTEFGGGIDGTGGGGIYRTSMNESMCICIFPQRLEVGQSIDVRMRGTLFTQIPWNATSDQNFAYCFSNFLRIYALPEAS